MTAQRLTTSLLFLVLVVAAVDLAAHWSAGGPTPIQLVSLPGFDPAQADRITLADEDGQVVLERAPDGWRITAPTAGRAHQPAVEELLAAVSAGIEPDARVDLGDHERYGLAGGDELRVRIEGAAITLTSFVVGHDAGGGSTWVRWAGSDAVYRARIGGRATYERTPRAWRDLQVTRLDPDQLHTFRIIGSERIVITRTSGGWTHAWRDLDGPTIEQLVAGLCELRGLEVAAPGPVAPDVTVELEGAGAPVVLAFEQVGDLWFVGRQDVDGRWRVPSALPAMLIRAPESLVNRTLWRRSASPVVRIERIRGAERRVLAQTETGWVRREDAGDVALDPTRASAAGVWLSGPRVSAWVHGLTPRQVGFPAREQWIVTFADGRTRILELAGETSLDGMRHVAVRERRRLRRIGWVDDRVVQSIQALFGE